MMQTSQKLTIYSPQSSEPKTSQTDPIPPAIKVRRHKLTAGERLLRNSAIACAILFALLSMKNLPYPAAQATASIVEKALTVDFDVDETLGELHFVRRMLPESALVFWNIPSFARMMKPIDGALLHEYTEVQPWYTFAASNGTEVCAPREGTLTEARQLSSGDWKLTISHEDGAATIIAFVDRGSIEIGEAVSMGEVIASASLQGCVFVEYQKDGKPQPVGEFRS